MRKIIVVTFVTLDGVMQAPGAPEEDATNNFKWGGWMANYSDQVMDETLTAVMSAPFDLLLGRRTYEIFAAYWPFIENNPISDRFNSIHKYTVSHKPMELTWSQSTQITGDVVEGLRQLKAQDGPNLLVHGSRVLVQTLLEHGLVDLLQLWIHPLTIGTGKRLFEGGTQPRDWKLVDSKVASTGVILASYEPAGALTPGTMITEAPSALELKRREQWAKEG
jgi:dihydrofolate reductase